jgi:DNA-binding protein HU-beta
MNKGDLIDSVAGTLALPQKGAKEIVEAFSDIVRTTLLTGEEVTIPGVGKLKVNVRPARAGRNPSTGAAIAIPEKRVVKFTPAASFKGEVSAVPAIVAAAE